MESSQRGERSSTTEGDPVGFHMGGIWERQIRTVRMVMNAILKEQTLDNESLSTLSCDFEATIKGRPLTTVSDDPNDECSLTPNHPLLLRGRRWVHYIPQVLFKAVIFMESAEGMYNIWLINFGRGGFASTYLHCSSGRSGCKPNAIWSVGT